MSGEVREGVIEHWYVVRTRIADLALRVASEQSIVRRRVPVNPDVSLIAVVESVRSVEQIISKPRTGRQRVRRRVANNLLRHRIQQTGRDLVIGKRLAL